MDVEPVIALIKSLALGFRQYSGAEELADIQEQLKVLPAVFVVPLSLSGAPNSMVGIVDQKITQRFSVIAVFRKLARGELHNIEIALLGALVGWVHPDMGNGAPGSPAEFISQRTFNLFGTLATSLDFTTTYHFRK